MIKDWKNMIAELRDDAGRLGEKTLVAGTRFRLMALVADMTEVTAMLQTEVLTRVSQEAVLDADADVDYGELAEEVLAMEMDEGAEQDESVGEQVVLVNEAIAALSSMLAQIAEQLERRHRDEEYERLYEQEKRRYLSSGTARRSRHTFEEWLYDVCYGTPGAEDFSDYITEKLLHLFEKGVFDAKVEHVQRAKRYSDEVGFDHLDDDHRLKKSVYKHYAVLRKLVDWREGRLEVNAVRADQHFYSSRHEENAKAHRTAFLKYMHKIEMAQQERGRVLAVRQEGKETDLCSLLPEVLASRTAMKYWKRLQEAGFVDERCQLKPTTTRKQAMYIADVFSDKLQLSSTWKPFQDLWSISNLAQEKWEMLETGKKTARSDEIDRIFGD